MPIEFPALLAIRLERFPDLLSEFLDDNPLTLAIEEYGVQLQEQNFPIDACHDFVRYVCEWGGQRGPAIRANLLGNSSPENIRRALLEATEILAEENHDVGNAVNCLIELHGLHISFASKHLRFLRPDLCPVLDSIISRRMFYQSNVIGYRAFSAFCGTVAMELNNSNIVHPVPVRNEWLRADVEASIFTYFDVED